MVRGVRIPWLTSQKKLKKPLDKPLKMWYHKDTEKEQRAKVKVAKKVQKK